MPRSRVSDMSQQLRQQSPRAPLHLKTTSSAESNGAHRPVRDRSPKLEEHRRSPRSPLPEQLGVCNQKKRGTRVADLETRLGHAQEELKKLKEKLASAETARRETQQQLDETKKMVPPTLPVEDAQARELGQPQILKTGSDEETGDHPQESDSPAKERAAQADPSVDNCAADEGESIVKGAGEGQAKDEEETIAASVEEPEEVSSKPAEESTEEEVVPVPVALADVEPEMGMSELEICQAENASFKRQLAEAESNAAASRAKEDELVLKLRTVTEDLEQSSGNAQQLTEQLKATEEAKAALEAEMKKLRIQTDQWRKAADAAAAIISGDERLGLDVNGGGRGRRSSAERCRSMDNHFGYEPGLIGSPLMGGELLDDGFSGGKRKSGGIRMFGDLWKKRVQQK